MTSLQDLLLAVLLGRGVLPPLGAFAIAGIAVYAVASHLTRYADDIAAATGLGRLLIGTLLLAAATSLPELIVDVNAALLDVPDIGVGDLFGSTLANMLLLALLDLSYRRVRVLDHVSPAQARSGVLAVVLTAMAGAAIAAGGWGRVGHVGTETILIVATYLLFMKVTYERAKAETLAETPASGATSNRVALRRGIVGFALAAIGLIAIAPVFVVAAEAVAIESGLGETLVGTLLVGFSTSLPEVGATIAAVRMGAFDLAVGNIFGSNAFNMCILFAMDLAYVRGPVLAHVSQDHLVSAQFAIVAVAIGVLGILTARAAAPGRLRIASLLIILTYAGAAWMLANATGA